MKLKDVNMSSMSTVSSMSLYDFLQCTDFLLYYRKFKDELKLRHIGDLAFCEERDFVQIGMSRPEQKRLLYEFNTRLFNNANAKASPNEQCLSSLAKKFKKKLFGINGNFFLRRAESVKCNTSKNCLSIANIKTTNVEQHVISIDQIQLSKELGRGDFGQVYQATWHCGNSSFNALQVAVKKILPEKLLSNSVSFLQEATIMTKIFHENIIRLYGVVLNTNAVMLVSELAPCGSLLECLQCPAWREPFSITTLCDFALQIAQGMRYLANQQLIHRDLAARNVLVSSPTKVKISDFGLSRSLGVGKDYYCSELNSKMRLLLAWCAPECIKFLRFTIASDVWAYGVTLWEMFSYGKIPWNNMTGLEIINVVDNKRETLNCPEACSREIYQLMEKCWSYEPADRLTFDAICQSLPGLMPQLLITIADSKNNNNWRYLQYKKGDIIILLNKCTEKFGEFCNSEKKNNVWFGALKRGGKMMGLFFPHETVAYLDAENPTSSLCKINNSATLSTIETSKKFKFNKKKKKEQLAKPGNDIERRKLLISQPQGLLQHTCHIGIDGKSFNNSISDSELPKHNLLFQKKNQVISIKEVESNAALPIPLDRKVPPVEPPIPVPRQLLLNKTDQNVGKIISDTVPPKLPPKTYRLKKTTNEILSATKNSKLVNPAIKESVSAFTFLSVAFLQAKTSVLLKTDLTGNDGLNKCVDYLTLRYFPSTIVCESEPTATTSDNALDSVICNLQKDISDFSLFTCNDFSDTRPLLDGEWLRAHELQLQNCNKKLNDEDLKMSIIRNMTVEEHEKWKQRILEEHKRAEKLLTRESDVKLKTLTKPKSDTLFSKIDYAKYFKKMGNHNNGKMNTKSDACLTTLPFALSKTKPYHLFHILEQYNTQTMEDSLLPKNTGGLFTSQLLRHSLKVPIEENWTDEAQAAYKQLVQNGNNLKTIKSSQCNSVNTKEKVRDKPIKCAKIKKQSKKVGYICIFDPSHHKNVKPDGSLTKIVQIETNNRSYSTTVNKNDRDDGKLNLAKMKNGVGTTTADQPLKDNEEIPIMKPLNTQLYFHENICSETAGFLTNSSENLSFHIKINSKSENEGALCDVTPPPVPPKFKKTTS